MKRTRLGLIPVLFVMCTCGCKQPSVARDVPDRTRNETNASPVGSPVATTVNSETDKWATPDEWETWIRSIVQPNMALSALDAEIGPGIAGTDHAYIYFGPEGRNLAIFVDESRTTVIHAFIHMKDGSSQKLF